MTRPAERSFEDLDRGGVAGVDLDEPHRIASDDQVDAKQTDQPERRAEVLPEGVDLRLDANRAAPGAEAPAVGEPVPGRPRYCRVTPSEASRRVVPDEGGRERRSRHPLLVVD